jgi:predicted AlkP superfamily phosphohydrolase/phosphomutase
MSGSGPVVVLGFDGLSPHLLRLWTEAGHLPHFARLLREGCGGVLQSTPQPNSAAAWSSFATGLNPGRHGLFAFMSRLPHSYACRRIDSRDRQGTPFWEVAGQSGARCAVLHVPVTYPSSPVNGVMVADWLCPSLSSPGATYPATLAADLQRELPGHLWHADVKRHALAGRHSLALRNLLHAMDSKIALADAVWQRGPWDLFLTVMPETDAAAHYYLHGADPAHPLHRQARAAGLDNVLLQVYQRADACVGQWLTRLPDEATLVILSDHGATANTHGRAHLRSALRHLGYLKLQGPTLSSRFATLRRRSFESLSAHLPKSAKVHLNRLLPGARERVFADAFTRDVDWATTRAYSYYWETDPYLNLAGREPAGIVDPADYEPLCAELTQALLALRNADPDLPAISEILRGRSAYHGPYASLAPDLLVRWTENQLVTGLRVGDAVTTPEMREDTVGAHHPEGVLLLWGRGVKPGPLPPAAIIDLAPSLLALKGCAIPADLDGRVLTEALDVSVPATTSTPPLVPSPGDYTAADETVITRRLADLGYL